MTATEELRALLDARGVDWTAHDNAWVNETYWKDASGKPVWAGERVAPAGNLVQSDLVQKWHTTPAQAVELTLGRGTCRIEERHGEWRCTGCGEIVGDSDPWSELYINGNAIELWKYCPRCGREVVEV